MSVANRLLAALAGYDGVLVAFSGGVDSAVVLAAAVRALGPDRVVAATAVSDSLARGEWAAAQRFAESLGVRHEAVATRELDRDGYRANGADRCFFCKDELLGRLLPVARAHALAVVATGTNADDLVAGFRPGIRAAAAHGAVTPLADAGAGKQDVRDLARRWRLGVWDKPQAACLSSRIAYGIAITGARLARVDAAEDGLRDLLVTAAVPVVNLRVRDLGDQARIEVDAGHVDAVAALPGLAGVMAAAGFARWDVDPRGFRSGSMNDVLLSRTPADG